MFFFLISYYIRCINLIFLEAVAKLTVSRSILVSDMYLMFLAELHYRLYLDYNIFTWPVYILRPCLQRDFSNIANKDCANYINFKKK